MYASTRARVTSPMSGALFSTFETVVTDTPSSAAICFMVGGGTSLPGRGGGCVAEPHGQPCLRGRSGGRIRLQPPTSRRFFGEGYIERPDLLPVRDEQRHRVAGLPGGEARLPLFGPNTIAADREDLVLDVHARLLRRGAAA